MKKTRQTKQRQVIASVIKNSDQLLTIEQIYELASTKLRNLGMSTVYRTVKLLCETDGISCVTLPDNRVRYECARLKHHHHLFCQSCERVFRTDHCGIGLPERTLLSDGFLVESHKVVLYGKCTECKEPSP